MSRGVLRVVTLNVLFGGEDRFERILALLRTWQPDLLVLQECLQWETGDRLSRVAAALQVPAAPEHVHLGRARPRPSGKRYHVAVLSRRAMSSAVDHADPAVVGHCVVECELRCDDGATLTVLGAHFDAHDEDQRLGEARFVNSRLARLPQDSRALLAGDLNALSPRDPYPPDLDELLRRAGTHKYGHPARYEVITELESAGWVDALRVHPMSPMWVTARRNRGGVAIDYRTDYLFASPGLAEAVIGARVLAVEGASDHEAVEATLAI